MKDQILGVCSLRLRFSAVLGLQNIVPIRELARASEGGHFIVQGKENGVIVPAIISFFVGHVALPVFSGIAYNEDAAGNIPNISAVCDAAPAVDSGLLVGVLDDQKRGSVLVAVADQRLQALPHGVTVAHFDICRDKGLDRVKDAELRPISGQQLLQEVAVKFDGLETLVGDVQGDDPGEIGAVLSEPAGQRVLQRVLG